MKIYCINLARSTDRRAFQLAQAERLGLDIEFVDAVDFKLLPENELIEAAQCWTRPIVGKDVGCFRSHKKAWEMVARGSQPAMVIEDDIVFSSTLPKVLQAIEEQAFPENRVYDLEYAPRKHVVAKQPLWVSGTIYASRMFINKNGAGCYILSAHVAKKLLDQVQSFVMTDSWLWSRPWIEQVQVEPCAAVQQQDLESKSLEVVASTQGEVPYEYVQHSWLVKKSIRWRLIKDQAKSLLLALQFGESRYLMFQPQNFKVTST